MSKIFFAVGILPLSGLVHADIPASVNDTSPAINETMVVTASRFEQPISTVLAPISIVTRADIEEFQAKSLLDVLKVLPGIEIGQNGGRGQNASIFLRGTESNHVLVLLDGVRLVGTMMGTIDFNLLPLNTVERIEVIRGSGATVYGSDAIGGVINIITRSDVESKRFSLGGGSFGTTLASAAITTQLTDSLAMQIQGGFEQADGYNVRPINAQPETEHGFANKNASLRLSYSPKENWNSNLISRWYQNHVEYDSFGLKKNSWIESLSIGADSAYRSGKWNNLARIELGEQKNYDYFDASSRTDADLTSHIRQLYGSLVSRYQAQEALAVTAGVDVTLEKYQAGNFISAADIIDNPRQNWGVFGLMNWNVTDSILFETSLRHDQNQQFGANTTKLIALGWHINPEYRLFASYGNAFKAPSFDSLYGYGGNADLKPETSENLEVGLDGASFGVSWSINGYINKIDNLINYDFTIPLAMNIDSAEIKGLELSADFDIGSVYNQLSLDFRDPKDKTKNEQLARRAKQVFKWRTSLWLGDVLLGTQFLYQSERPDYSGGEMLASYHVWDVTAQYDLTNQITVSTKVSNLLDEKYQTAGDYPAPERGFHINLDFSY